VVARIFSGEQELVIALANQVALALELTRLAEEANLQRSPVNNRKSGF